MAYIFATYSFRGKSVLHALLTIPFVMPTVVVASAFLALVGQGGMLNQALQRWFGFATAPLQLEHSLALILAAHVFLMSVLSSVPLAGFEDAKSPSSGICRGPGRTPLVHLCDGDTAAAAAQPSCCKPASLSVLFYQLRAILILGGPSFATLEVEIYRQAVYYFNLPVAATLTIAQLVVTFTIMIIYTRMQARTSRQLRTPGREDRQATAHVAAVDDDYCWRSALRWSDCWRPWPHWPGAASRWEGRRHCNTMPHWA